jgi:hypothetical protein
MSHPAPGPVRLPEKVMEVRGMQSSASWTASLARRLGLDANPLRRGTDRAEAWIRIALVLAFLVGAPLAGWGAGHWAGSVAAAAVDAQLAGDHLVTATLLRRVPSGPDQQITLGLGLAKARWAGPGGSVRTGYVQAPPGSRAGSTVQVWLDRSGALTVPPSLLHRQVRGWVLMMAVLAPVVLALLLLAVTGLLGHVLDRRRLAGWTQAWSAVEPQWTRRLR